MPGAGASTRSLWLMTLAVAVAAIAFFVQYEGAPMDTIFPPQEVNETVEAPFSENYYQARALFRARASEAGATLHILPLEHIKEFDLTIDVAVIEGAKDSMLLHVSGTHGVEGFAGSAIQSVLLENSAIWKKQEGKAPTVVFVHALNPYGFAQLRRYNEHNVDLNRNWLTPAEFEAMTSADPNQYGYVDVYDLLNPSPAKSGALWFWLRAARFLVTKGFRSAKAATVSGNYRYPSSLFFCGIEKQPSLQLLEAFLKDTMHIGEMKSFGMIDVHTGLGKVGVDTLIPRGGDATLLKQVYAADAAAGHIAGNASATDVSSGYSTATGYVDGGVYTLLSPDVQPTAVAFAQEFGTLPAIFVLKALTQENAYYQHARPRRLPFAEKVRDVFYLHRSASWRQSVLERGRSVFFTLYAHLSRRALLH